MIEYFFRCNFRNKSLLKILSFLSIQMFQSKVKKTLEQIKLYSSFDLCFVEMIFSQKQPDPYPERDGSSLFKHITISFHPFVLVLKNSDKYVIFLFVWSSSRGGGNSNIYPLSQEYNALICCPG